ncbi:MAG: hypothetical protein P8X63_00505 [Desulfuromonadaceae bacterium]|jgi:hypothetical protein
MDKSHHRKGAAMLGTYHPSDSKDRRKAQNDSAKTSADETSVCRLHNMGPLLVFLLASIVAVRVQDVHFMELMPVSLHPFLGQPPSAHLISIALSVYFVSMVVIICHGICDGSKPTPSWIHLGYRCTFYLLYFTADALPENLIAVLLSGLILMGLEFMAERAYRLKTNPAADNPAEG